MRFEVICRACGHDMMVLAFRSTGQSRWMPEACPKCESDDLVALRDLTQAEQEEIERVIADAKRSA